MKEMLANRVHSNRSTSVLPRIPTLQDYLQELVRENIVVQEDLDNLPIDKRTELAKLHDRGRLLGMLTEEGLITEYQATRIEAGTRFGLVLANYRVLDRLGAGANGIVFRGEHVLMRRQVAIKIFPFGNDADPVLVRRFITEIRTISRLNHPNIVGAIDAGMVVNPSNPDITLYYFVMEYVPGHDLDQYVRSLGRMPPHQACDIAHQLAGALAEAHKQQLIHRDIKPANIQITPEGQVKLLDFGLACSHLQPTGTNGVFGTVGYMAPEQVQQSERVDARADLFGLGGVLFYCLTGYPPFSSKGNRVHDLANRMREAPSPRLLRSEITPELGGLVQRLLSFDPNDRYQTAQAVMRALVPFLKNHPASTESPSGAINPTEPLSTDPISTIRPKPAMLIVDDEPGIRQLCKIGFQQEGFHCDEADTGNGCLDMMKRRNYDVVILDIQLPDVSGVEVCRRIRQQLKSHLKILMTSGGSNNDLMAEMLLAGADDFVTKPFQMPQFQARVKSALKLKEAQERADLLNKHLVGINEQLEKTLQEHQNALVGTRNSLALTLAKVVEGRVNSRTRHPYRLQQFVRFLAEEAATTPQFGADIDESFIEMLVCCAPLHDLGKIGLPDFLLQKTGSLDQSERRDMEKHTLMGSLALKEAAQLHNFDPGFTDMADLVIRHHHEWYDGTGYPDHLQGNDIPLAARIVAIGDVYDALRSPRPHRPARCHRETVQVMTELTGRQLDPALMRCFAKRAPDFDRVFVENPD